MVLIVLRQFIREYRLAVSATPASLFRFDTYFADYDYLIATKHSDETL
jgi:hypothetical protein